MAYNTNTLNVYVCFPMMEIYLRFLKKHQVHEENSLQNTNKIIKSRASGDLNMLQNNIYISLL